MKSLIAQGTPYHLRPPSGGAPAHLYVTERSGSIAAAELAAGTALLLVQYTVRWALAHCVLGGTVRKRALHDLVGSMKSASAPARQAISARPELADHLLPTV